MNLVKTQEKVLGELPQLNLLYTIKEKIGTGAFGQVYRAVYNKNGKEVAIKTEKKASDTRQQTLIKEGTILKALDSLPGFPKVIESISTSTRFIIIQKLFSFDLDKLLRMCGGSFTLKTTIVIAEQMISRLKALHSKGVVHRDIKPENIMVGSELEDFAVFHLIDFGLSKFFKNKDETHIPFCEKRGVVGTVRYCSINSHSGKELSRRDDLISLGYLLVYFLKGKLPWQDLQVRRKTEKYEKILEVKQKMPLETLCQNLPNEFLVFLKYSMSLNYFETPNYSKLQEMFSSLYERKGFKRDNLFDWNGNAEVERRFQKHSKAKASEKHSESSLSHDYNKESMSEGPKNMTFEPGITQLGNPKEKPKLGEYLAAKKNKNCSKIVENQTKESIWKRTKIQKNFYLDFYYKHSEYNESYREEQDVHSGQPRVKWQDRRKRNSTTPNLENRNLAGISINQTGEVIKMVSTKALLRPNKHTSTNFETLKEPFLSVSNKEKKSFSVYLNHEFGQIDEKELNEFENGDLSLEVQMGKLSVDPFPGDKSPKEDIN